MRSSLPVTLLLGALAFSPAPAAADEAPPSLEQLVVEMAHAPADHAALASYYRGKAAAARADATSHQRLARVYTGGKFNQRAAMQSHCKKIAAKNQALAQEFEALAKLHDEESRKAQ